MTTGHPGTSLTGERCLEESGVDAVLSHPPVWSLTLQDPLGILRTSNKRRFGKIEGKGKLENFNQFF